MKNDEIPTISVMSPSIRNSHLQPAHPATPRMCKRANARIDVIMVVAESVVQKKLLRFSSVPEFSLESTHLSRVGSSREV